MPVNMDKPTRWKEDIAKSVDAYNEWFMVFAPKAFKDTRAKTTEEVKKALEITDNLRHIDHDVLKNSPSILPTLRMSTCPPIARDRLIGLAGVSKNTVNVMEDGKLPTQMESRVLREELDKIGRIIEKLADEDIFPWLLDNKEPSKDEVYRASTIVADRLCGAVADPIVRNAQEKRQLDKIDRWLKAQGYVQCTMKNIKSISELKPGTYCFHGNVKCNLNNDVDSKTVNVSVDVVVIPKDGCQDKRPLLIEAKSAGDFTNVNKRRKEEAKKMAQIESTYKDSVRYILFLCGFFDAGYLGYEAADAIDWVWEHRIDDLHEFCL